MFPPSPSWGRKSKAPDEPFVQSFLPCTCPPPRFRAFQFRMAAVDEYAHQTPMRRRQAFSLLSWHWIILFTHSLSSASRFLVDRRQPIRQGLAGLGKSLALCFCPGAGLCGLRPSRRPPPPRVVLRDLGAPSPLPGVLIAGHEFPCFLSSLMVSPTQNSERRLVIVRNTGANWLENVQYIFL